jgi:hypothetical protein
MLSCVFVRGHRIGGEGIGTKRGTQLTTVRYILCGKQYFSLPIVELKNKIPRNRYGHFVRVNFKFGFDTTRMPRTIPFTTSPERLLNM